MCGIFFFYVCLIDSVCWKPDADWGTSINNDDISSNILLWSKTYLILFNINNLLFKTDESPKSQCFLWEGNKGIG